MYGDVLAPHTKILDLIRDADYGIIAYPPNPSTANSIPTKLYEYLGFRLPILLVSHPVWSSLANRYQTAIEIDFQHPDASAYLSRMRHELFYPVDPQDVYWDHEEDKLRLLFG